MPGPIAVLGHPLTAWQISTGAGLATLTALAAAYRLARALRGKKAADTLTIVAAAMASSVAATGMWHFFSRTMHLPTWIQAVLFAFMEIAVLASALRARANVARDGQAGADGLAVWVLTSASGLMSASEATSPQEALVRLGAPLVAAWLWERSMVPERRAQRAAAAQEGRGPDGVIAKITHTMKERLLASLGVTAPNQSALEIRQNKALDEVVETTIHLGNLHNHGRFLLGIRSRRLTRRRAEALRLSGAPQDPSRQLLALDMLAVIQHAGDLDRRADDSPWAAHRTARTEAAQDPSAQEQSVTVAQLPGIVAAALMLARRGAEPEPEDLEPEDPAERLVTAGELPGIFATAYLLAQLHGATAAHPNPDDTRDDTPTPRHPDTGTQRHGDTTRDTATARHGDTAPSDTPEVTPATPPNDTPADTPELTPRHATDTRVTVPTGATLPAVTPRATVTRAATARVKTLPVHDLDADVAHVSLLAGNDIATWPALSKADAIRAADQILPGRAASQIVRVLGHFDVTVDAVLVRKTRSRDRQSATPTASQDLAGTDEERHAS